jgi:hypothetical protein
MSDSPKYVFIDESEGKIDGRKYHVAVASVWHASALKPFRSELLKQISNVINPVGTVNPLPELHGSDMAPSYSDDIKLNCYRILAELVSEYDVKVYRLGYFDNIPLVETDIDRLALSISQICAQISREETGDLIYVYELNSSKHTKIANLYNDTKNQYYAAAVGAQNISVPNLDNIIGRFYCDKENVFMSATDAAANFLLQCENQDSGLELGNFTSKSFPLMKPIQECVKYNEIIQINSWPTVKNEGDPIRYMFPVIPSDTENIHMSADFIKKLKEYWEQKSQKRSQNNFKIFF